LNNSQASKLSLDKCGLAQTHMKKRVTFQSVSVVIFNSQANNDGGDELFHYNLFPSYSKRIEFSTTVEDIEKFGLCQQWEKFERQGLTFDRGLKSSSVCLSGKASRSVRRHKGIMSDDLQFELEL